MTTTALAASSEKSSPSEAFPRQTARKAAPLLPGAASAARYSRTAEAKAPLPPALPRGSFFFVKGGIRERRRRGGEVKSFSFFC